MSDDDPSNADRGLRQAAEQQARFQGVINNSLRAENAKLRMLLTSASHALRSYQHGNSSPELAREVADIIDKETTRP